MGSNEFIPSSFRMQWHILDRCNLRCQHCYQESFSTADPSFDFLLEVLDQFTETVRYFNRKRQESIPAGINLTGGEPFLREDLFDLLDRIAKHRSLFHFALLSNGTRIDRALARRLSRLRPDYVQISLDGMKETHDKIRGEGSFDQAVEGIRHLCRSGIRTLLSFTVHQMNDQEFEQVALLGRDLGVAKIWSDRMIPTNPDQLANLLSPQETNDFFREMRRVRDSFERIPFFTRIQNGIFHRKKTIVSMNRALQFLEGGGPIYHCSAGRSLIAVLPDGSLLPCRRLPIPAGNVKEKSLLEWYRTSPVLKELRKLESECQGCIFQRSCGGGLRCLSYRKTGDPFSGDPDCPLRISPVSVSEVRR